MHRLTRILSTALITAGLVALADAGLTLFWQEPMSAAYSSIQQDKAEDELEELEKTFPTAEDLAAIAGVRGNVARAQALAGIFRGRIENGDAIGRISIERMDLDIVLVQGTDTTSLQKGPGHYEKTLLPGQRKPVGIAGHRTTYLAPFRDIDKLDPGDQIRVQMPYAGFTYTVTKHDIVDPSAVEILDPVGYEQLVLTACHPVHSAAQRYAIFAKLTRIDTFAPGGTGAWVAP